MNGSFFGSGGNTPFFQAKLTVNQPGDQYEQEADAVADQVMRMRDGEAPIVQRMPVTPVTSVQRNCAECEQEGQEQLHRGQVGKRPRGERSQGAGHAQVGNTGSLQEEIQRVERERAELFKTTQTNNEALVKVRAELAKAGLEAERFRKTADAYKEGFDKANESIRQQNEGLLKMKSDITKVLAERNQAVEKYNELVKLYDEAVQKLNDLVQKWNAQQEELKKQAEPKK